MRRTSDYFSEYIYLLMLKILFDNKFINRLIMAAMIGVVYICIRPPGVVLLKRIASHSTQIMLLFLLVGLFFLVVDQKRLLFTAFGCSAALCLYFKNVANISLILPVKTAAPSLTILQSSASELGEDFELSLHRILQEKADVICFLELTPNWEQILRSSLTKAYPNRAELTRVDFYGLAIYSKYRISEIDTIYYDDIPTIQAGIQLDDMHKIQVYASNTSPPLFRKSFEQLQKQLDIIAGAVQQSHAPTITAGNYNLDQFSEELQGFRARAKLNDSRKSMSPSLNPPTHHLFYTDALECLSFENIYDSLNYRVGIVGEYQIKTPTAPLVGKVR